ncbi:DUF3732 domain-containing protein [Maribellus maritimus]|uniref:DUF3732 domain-containing protein n=1 Tax=Maribellus maritimus TaxID=2870838 RepID=UPI001EEA23BD|nr:DUF3732 domain-containing protein [Maribellus maritimus]MCG6189979.1 DUF3732 domain-containing protein [Maribellus maritimus]
MKSYIKYIGLLDKNDKCHYIDLKEGLNIITGRSSTGKSAIIEIFDFCFGNSENSIPEGIITDNAKLYFVVFEINNTSLILARNQEEKSTYVFFKIDPNFPSLETLNSEYFHQDYYLPLKTFKEELGRYFGLNISSTDEDNQALNYKVKKGRPSVRNMISYILQHQNLIANKHSLFYRFDEKEKRERTIDEFKIFTGYVDQDYFTLKQQINDKKQEYERKVRDANLYQDEKKKRIVELEELLDEYYMVAGNPLLKGYSAQNMLEAPKLYLDKIQEIDSIKVDDNSNIFREQYAKFEAQRNELLASRRKIVLKLENINSSINYARKYSETIDMINPISEAIKEDSHCPFCLQENQHTNKQINKLTDAIDWLNSELRKAPLMIDSFLPEKQKCENELAAIDSSLRHIRDEINKILKVNAELEKNKSLEEQGFKIRLSIENLLEWSLDRKNRIKDLNIEQLSSDIERLEKKLKNDYNINDKLREAEIFINKTMNELGNKLDFEKSYQPINLNFDIANFELYHLKTGESEVNGKKVYLRSMGSGANWLYSHICLFLSLQKYFCSLGSKCLIPSILFLDQPSQVYFPTIVDNDRVEFNPKKLKEIEGALQNSDVDLNAVTNLFNQIIYFIKKTDEEYGITPQVIVSDHADNLELDGDSFENYVRKRWRKENDGFIDLSKLTQEDQDI